VAGRSRGEVQQEHTASDRQAIWWLFVLTLLAPGLGFDNSDLTIPVHLARAAGRTRPLEEPSTIPTQNYGGGGAVDPDLRVSAH